MRDRLRRRRVPRRRRRPPAQGPGRPQRARAERAHHQAHRRGGHHGRRQGDAPYPRRGGAQRHRRPGQRRGRRHRRQRQGLRLQQNRPARLLQRGRLPRGLVQPTTASTRTASPPGCASCWVASSRPTKTGRTRSDGRPCQEQPVRPPGADDAGRDKDSSNDLPQAHASASTCGRASSCAPPCPPSRPCWRTTRRPGSACADVVATVQFVARNQPHAVGAYIRFDHGDATVLQGMAAGPTACGPT